MATTGAGKNNQHEWGAREAMHQRNYLAIRDYTEMTRGMIKEQGATIKGLQAQIDQLAARTVQLESQVRYLLAKTVNLGDNHGD
jgi:hypothetical protein